MEEVAAAARLSLQSQVVSKFPRRSRHSLGMPFTHRKRAFLTSLHFDAWSLTKMLLLPDVNVKVIQY